MLTTLPRAPLQRCERTVGPVPEGEEDCFCSYTLTVHVCALSTKAHVCTLKHKPNFPSLFHRRQLLEVKRTLKLSLSEMFCSTFKIFYFLKPLHKGCAVECLNSSFSHKQEHEHVPKSR